MKMDISILDKLAEMICGDSPYDNFPYRSSSYLTRFFRGVDLDYVHDGSTRRLWVSNVLEELNKEDNSDPDLPSPKLIKVIEYLLNPVHFKNSTGDYESAIKEVNEILQIKNLIIVKVGLTNNVKLQKIVSGYVSTSISSDEAKNVITFTPSVFDVPNKSVEANLVSVMIPFDISFDNVLEAIKAACSSLDLNCKRVDDIWINSIIIQDIFELIYCSSIVIVDFSGKNPNVFYEVGIAHTLGKHVIPITQHIGDVPFDLIHHRVIPYLNNKEGLDELKRRIEERLRVLKEQSK